MNGRAQFRPCIDLHDGRVKQIVGGTLNTASGEKELETNFVSERDSAYFAAMYRQDRLEGGHVIQLGPGNEAAACAALAAWPDHLQLGGGVTAANAGKWLDCGAAKVIVTSFVFFNGALCQERLEQLLRAVGRERLVLDLSCRRCADGSYRVVTDRWKNFTSLTVGRETLEKLSASCAEFLIHAVDVEGRRAGIDRELLAILAEHSPIPCVYAGGVASFADVETIERAGNGKVHYTIGSALDIFGGTLSYAAVAAHSRGES